MHKLTAYVAGAMASLCLWSHAEEAPLALSPERQIAGWGTAYDPDGDCKFIEAEDALFVGVPGSRPHDLAAEIKTTNAPRVLQAVSGDFTIQVCTEGGFAPGAESTKSGRTGYNGAAVVAMIDPRNVVTLARAVLQRGTKTVGYANFELRVDGRLQRIGRTGDQALPEDGPVHLRLERRGVQFFAAVSLDGVNWNALQPKDVPPAWPLEMETGVAVISTSKHEFLPRFSELKLSEAQPPAKSLPLLESERLKAPAGETTPGTADPR